MTEHAFTIPTRDGIKLAAVFTHPVGPPPYKTTVLAHGYRSGKDNSTNTKLAPLLDARGIATLRFDFRGHYASGGDIADVTITAGLSDLDAVMAWVKTNSEIDMNHLALMGGSYGGIVAELYAARHDLFRCLVLKAPALEWGQGHPEIQKIVDDARNYDTYAAGEHIGCPTLLVHGDADEAVPYQQSERLAQVLGDQAKLVIVPGADHRFTKDQDFELMIKESLDFIAGQLD